MLGFFQWQAIHNSVTILKGMWGTLWMTGKSNKKKKMRGDLNEDSCRLLKHFLAAIWQWCNGYIIQYLCPLYLFPSLFLPQLLLVPPATPGLLLATSVCLFLGLLLKLFQKLLLLLNHLDLSRCEWLWMRMRGKSMYGHCVYSKWCMGVWQWCCDYIQNVIITITNYFSKIL